MYSFCRFKVIDEGTHFWHSHTGVQRGDGLFGAFIVREPTDVHEGLYDFDLPEHVIFINSWYNELTINKFNSFYHAEMAVFPDSLLINDLLKNIKYVIILSRKIDSFIFINFRKGKGRYKEFQAPNTNDSSFTPYEVFNVELGRRYRFRLINNAVANCAVQFSVDNHTLVVIASDGNAFEKIDVESLNVFAGERYDIVLTADQSVANYWIRVRGLGLCQNSNAFQQAIIHYKGASMENPDGPSGYWHGARTGKKLNPMNSKTTEDLISVVSLDSKQPTNDPALKETPDKKFYIVMDFNPIHFLKYHHPKYYPFPLPVPPKGGIDAAQINCITNIRPPAPLLTQYHDVPQEEFCNADTIKQNCTEDFCECVHMIKVGLGETVEFVMIDEGKRYSSAHPMHLHGQYFRVVGMDKVSTSYYVVFNVSMINNALNTTVSVEHVMELDKQGLLQRNLTNPPLKDTVTTQDGGYTIVRFLADNPGFWFFHCHVQLHQNNGMSMIIQVGELNQMPKPPKNFPQCRPWNFSGFQEPSGPSNNICTSGKQII
ncbi:hypothetical protein KUTeg_024956 [Tegillarca granosa]|uniref:Uncharacterized protein n=1 Tax=Tegillarca granosa TaxID=220873 RepID=A0ABQ9E4F9_TEGGR|nr:hypothetical protein KUTeg_024956 [Tegillarca granosa]